MLKLTSQAERGANPQLRWNTYLLLGRIGMSQSNAAKWQVLLGLPTTPQPPFWRTVTHGAASGAAGSGQEQFEISIRRLQPGVRKTEDWCSADTDIASCVLEMPILSLAFSDAIPSTQDCLSA
eukprot:6195543-Pleurochrysis_carterae.AAC.6